MSTDDVVGPRLRAVLSAPSPLRPGRPAPGSRDGLQDVSNENPYPPLPSVLEAVARAAAHAQPLPRHGQRALVERGRGAPRCARQRPWSPAPAASRCSGTSCRRSATRATRSSTPGGRSRRTRSSPRCAAPAPVQVPLAPTAGTTCRPWPPRSPTAPGSSWSARRTTPPGRRCTPRSSRRSSTRVPRDVLVVLDEAYVEFVRDEKMPRRPGRLAPSPERRAPAHVLQGLRAGRAARRLRRRARAARGRRARGGAAVRGVDVAQEAAIASLAAEAELLERVDALVAERERRRRPARRGLGGPRRTGELRLVRPGRADRRLRRRVHGRPASSFGPSSATARAARSANPRRTTACSRWPPPSRTDAEPRVQVFLDRRGAEAGVGRVGQCWRSVEITMATPATASAPPASSAPDATSPRSSQPRSTATTGLT